MHILILPSWYPDSPQDIGGSFFREQAIALRNGGCQVGVIAPRLRSLRNWRTVFSGPYGIQYENDKGVNTYRSFSMSWFIKMPNLRALQFFRHGMLLFNKYVEAYGKPDIIHVHAMVYAGLLALKIYEHENIPFIITEHSTAFARGLLSHSQQISVRKIAFTAKRRFAVSSPFVQLLEDTCGKESGRWEVLPNIVHKSFLSFPLKERTKRNELTFINICKLTQKKRVDLLLQAFAEAVKQCPGMRLRIGGAGEERPKLETLVNKLGLSDKVQFLGTLNRGHVVEQIAAADIFVLSSRYETFGVVLIEALALGKPVIATRCGGPEDIVEKENGLLVPPDNVQALSSAMQKLYRDIDKYDPLKIRRCCRTRFGEDVVVSKLKNIYRDVVSSCTA